MVGASSATHLGTSNGNPDQTFALPLARGAGRGEGAETRSHRTRAASSGRSTRRSPACRCWPARSSRCANGAAAATTGSRPCAGRLRGRPSPGSRPARSHGHDCGVGALARAAAFLSLGPRPIATTSSSARTGVFRFPGIDGFIPPAGSPIVVTTSPAAASRAMCPAGSDTRASQQRGLRRVGRQPARRGGRSRGRAAARGARSQRAEPRAIATARCRFEDYEWLARMRVLRSRACARVAAGGAGRPRQPWLRRHRCWSRIRGTRCRTASRELDRHGAATTCAPRARRHRRRPARVAPSYVAVGVRRTSSSRRATKRRASRRACAPALAALPASAHRRSRRPRLELRPRRLSVGRGRAGRWRRRRGGRRVRCN